MKKFLLPNDFGSLKIKCTKVLLNLQTAFSHSRHNFVKRLLKIGFQICSRYDIFQNFDTFF